MNVARSNHDGATDLVREIATSAAFITSRRAMRKDETVRACCRTNGGPCPSLTRKKKIMGLDCLRQRGSN